MKPFKQPLRGIVPPVVTPLLDRDTLDVAGLERVLEHLITGGVSGLFILGTTGEAPSLGYRVRREIIQHSSRITAGRVPLLVGITDTAFTESIALARHAADCGADAVVAAPPFYLPLGQPELQRYISQLTPELPVPLFLYNFPGLTKVVIEPETVRRAMDEPKIAGIKDSSGNMMYFKRLAALARTRADWTLLIGPEELLADSIFTGGHGGVSGGANIFPRLYVELARAADSGDLARAKLLQSHVLKISESLYTIGRHTSAFIKGIKCALSIMGICGDQMAEPFQALNEADRRRAEQIMPELIRLASDL